MRRWKRVIEIGRWRVAVMGGGRYRFGLDKKGPGAYSAGLGVCVVSALRRNKGVRRA